MECIETEVNSIMKTFTTTGLCVPAVNYMVNIDDRIEKIKVMVDRGDYFTINRARQYGKTTTLFLLAQRLQPEYYVLSLDFQGIGNASFETEEKFVKAFCRKLKREIRGGLIVPEEVSERIGEFLSRKEDAAELDELFDMLYDWCFESDKEIVFIIDEVDSASNNQVFLDFLAQLRDGYLKRQSGRVTAFKSVILAGVTDIKNLKRKIRPESAHKFNSPWNIAADFNIDMSLSAKGIAGMLDEYENDHHTGMDTSKVAQEIFDYTSGYPFLVSRICQLIDGSETPEWSVAGVSDAVKDILLETNTLFDSLMGKVYDNEPLSELLQSVLFGGERVSYNQYNVPAMDGEMYGFLINKNGALVIANRVFEVMLYNYFLSLKEMKNSPMTRSGSKSKEQIIENGHLNMEKLLERYVIAFDDIYEGKAETFSEEEGRRRFLLFIRPIINGTGNYYIEAQTRNIERMDVVIDYLGERFVVELKIWRGQAYHEKGEAQLAEYLDHYHLDRGYMLTYSFNKSKHSGLTTKNVNDKTLVEAFV